jgi:hypothetical protein
MRDIIDCIDIPIVVRETVNVEDKYIIAEAILPLIRKAVIEARINEGGLAQHSIYDYAKRTYELNQQINEVENNGNT